MIAAVANTPRVTVPTVLYHYTCRTHGEPGVRRDRELRPRMHFLLRSRLVWLTDLELPDAWALGLTRITLCCDRTQIRCSVATFDDDGHTDVMPWWQWARDRRVPPSVRDILEDPGAPMHWFVSPKPVPVTAMVDTNVLMGRTETRAH